MCSFVPCDVNFWGAASCCFEFCGHAQCHTVLDVCHCAWLVLTLVPRGWLSLVNFDFKAFQTLCSFAVFCLSCSQVCFFVYRLTVASMSSQLCQDSGTPPFFAVYSIKAPCPHRLYPNIDHPIPHHIQPSNCCPIPKKEARTILKISQRSVINYYWLQGFKLLLTPILLWSYVLTLIVTPRNIFWLNENSWNKGNVGDDHDVRSVECIKFKVLNPVISGMVLP